jgi:ribosome-interacting GTPase 1
MKINFQNPPKYLDEKMVYHILRDYKILNCEVLIRDDEATVDDLIDVVMKNHRTYIKVSLKRSTFPLSEMLCKRCKALALPY